MRFDDLGELGVLGKEAVARMDRVGAGDFGGRDDRGDVEIAVGGRRRADADRMVGQADMHRVGIGGRMHRHGLDAHFMRRAVDAERDLAAVGDQDAGNRACAGASRDHDERLVVFDRLRVLDQDRLHRAGGSAR